MKENILDDENYELEKQTKENRTKSKIKEYFNKNVNLIKNNFNNFLKFIGLGQIWSTENEQKLLWDKIVSYTIDKNNVDYEAVLCGISDFFEEEEDENFDENNKLNDNDNDLLLDIDLQSLHMRNLNSEEKENLKDSTNNDNCIDEFINNLKDKQELLYAIKFINEIYFNKYLENDNLDNKIKINKNDIFNEIHIKYKFINIPNNMLNNYFNYISNDSNNKKDELFIDKSVIKYVNTILNNKTEDNKLKIPIKSLNLKSSLSNSNNDLINNNINISSK